LISFENWKQGFLVTVAGQRLLWHSAKRPAVFVHRAGEMRSAWRSAGTCLPTMASGRSALFRFSSGLVMREELRDLRSGASLVDYSHDYHTAIFSLYFSSLDKEIDSVRLRFHDMPKAHWNGFGPREQHLARGTIALPLGARSAGFAMDGRFILCSSSGERKLRFGEAEMRFDLDLPAEVHFGYARTPAEACRLWRYSFGSLDFSFENPDELHRGVHSGTSQTLIAAAARAHSVVIPQEAAGLLGSLSFSGAGPEDYQQLNMAVAQAVREGSIWKYANLMLCQPDIALPAQFRREIGNAFISLGDILPARLKNRYAKIRAGLEKYWEFCRMRWTEDGIPALLHPSLLYPQDVALESRDDLLMAGADMVFAPNLKEKGELASLVLPEGEWVHFWTSRIYPSGRVTVHAPAGAPALFYRAGSEYSWLFDSVRQVASRL